MVEGTQRVKIRGGVTLSLRPAFKKNKNDYIHKNEVQDNR